MSEIKATFLSDTDIASMLELQNQIVLYETLPDNVQDVFSLNIGLFGCSGVGKTTFLDVIFNTNYGSQRTFGIINRTRYLYIKKENLWLHVVFYDTEGGDKVRYPPLVFRMCDIGIFVYSLIDEATYHDVDQYFQSLCQYLDRDSMIRHHVYAAIIGTKYDLLMEDEKVRIKNNHKNEKKQEVFLNLGAKEISVPFAFYSNNKLEECVRFILWKTVFGYLEQLKMVTSRNTYKEAIICIRDLKQSKTEMHDIIQVFIISQGSLHAHSTFCFLALFACFLLSNIKKTHKHLVLLGNLLLCTLKRRDVIHKHMIKTPFHDIIPHTPIALKIAYNI